MGESGVHCYFVHAPDAGSHVSPSTRIKNHEFTGWYQQGVACDSSSHAIHHRREPPIGQTQTRQGSYGDCTLIAALNGLVESQPELLASHIKATGGNGDGSQSYEVELYEENQWKTYQVNSKDIPEDASRDANGTINVGSL